MDTLYDTFSDDISNINEHDIILMSNIFSGMLVDHDSISENRLEKLMGLFEAISDAPSYHVPKASNDRKITFDAITRLGAKLIVYIKKHFAYFGGQNYYKPPDQVSQATHFTLKELEDLYRRYRALLVKFMDKSSLRLNAGEVKFIYLSFNFDFTIEQGYASNFVNKDVKIQSNDVYWT